MRCDEKGWRLVAMNDASGRRGVWFRLSEGRLEICAGRDGDDDYVAIAVGETIDPEQLAKIAGIFTTAEYALECCGLDSGVMECDCEPCRAVQRAMAANMSANDQIEAWREWFRGAGGGEWDKIEDVEKELGRGEP